MLLSCSRCLSLADARARRLLLLGGSSCTSPFPPPSSPRTACGLGSSKPQVSDIRASANSKYDPANFPPCGHRRKQGRTPKTVLLNRLAFVSSLFTRLAPSAFLPSHQHSSSVPNHLPLSAVQPRPIAIRETITTTHHQLHPHRSFSSFLPPSSCRLPSPSLTSLSSFVAITGQTASKKTSGPENFKRALCSSRRSSTFPSSPSASKMGYKVLVPIAEGSEEIEAVCIVDTLRRAGAEVIVANVMEGKGKQGSICMSRKVLIQPERSIKEVENEVFDMIAVPGGMPGAEHCRDSAELTKMLKDHKAKGKWIAAICASPAVVLLHHGLLEGEKAVAYPCFMDKMPAEIRASGSVCVSNKIVTSMGPATALEFSVKLVEVLYGAAKSKEVASALLVPQ